MQKEDIEIDLGFFFTLAEEKKDSIQTSTSKHSDRR